MASIPLQIAVQPPAVIRLHATLNPPLVVAMSSNIAINGYSSNLGRVWAFATLINDYGEVVNDYLQGNLAESALGFPNGDDPTGYYFLFNNLSIKSTGRFRIRVTLMRMDSSDASAAGAANVNQVESDLIVVEDRDVEYCPPSASEQLLLDSLAD